MTTTGTTTRPETTIAPPARVFDPLANNGSAADSAQNKSAPAQATDKPRAALPPIVFGDDIAKKVIKLPEELIAGVLHRAAKMVLGGGSKSFKTWCLADQAISISTGTPWWGRETKKGRVIYINFEVQPEFFETRLQVLSRAKNLRLPRELEVWNLRGHCSDHTVLLPELAARLRGEDYAAIFLDPVYKIMNGSENAQEEVAGLMDSIEKLGVSTGAATVFGAHFAKGNAAGKDAIDRISGSGVFARDPDAILTMTKHRDDDVFVIDPILRNCPPVEPFCVRWDFPLMVPAADLDPADLRQPPKPSTAKGKTPEDLLALVPMKESVGKKELLDAARGRGFSKHGAETTLKALLADEKLHEWKLDRSAQKTCAKPMISRQPKEVL